MCIKLILSTSQKDLKTTHIIQKNVIFNKWIHFMISLSECNILHINNMQWYHSNIACDIVSVTNEFPVIRHIHVNNKFLKVLKNGIKS